MKFFKLDTHVTRNFGTVLGESLEVFPTGALQVLAALVRTRGVPGAFTAVLKAVSGGTGVATTAVDGNVSRKKIRLPQIFDNPVIGPFYRAIKMVEAGLLHEALSDRLSASPPDVTIVYNGSNFPESVVDQIASEMDLPRVYVEAGFFPKTLQIDPVGLNGANSLPRDPSFYLDIPEDLSSEGMPGAVNNRPSKRATADIRALEPGYIFVPFQVPSDMQVTLHSPWVRTMEQFLDVVLAAAERHPDETFVIKEHPSFKRSVKGARPPHPRVIFANDNITSELIANARAVITLNSTVGVESLLIGTPVITLGNACYNIDGLVLHAEDEAALDRAIRTLGEWQPDARLRTQFIGYLWNRYLTHGSYDDLPKDLGDRLLRISRAHRTADPGDAAKAQGE